MQIVFLSTPSARRATVASPTTHTPPRDFYPRPPRGGRPGQGAQPCSVRHFYPRPPRGGRPAFFMRITGVIRISIHALREEGDQVPAVQYLIFHNFYPRPPRGGRQSAIRADLCQILISIHALREEGDLAPCCCPRRSGYFYPRPPRGGRRCRLSKSIIQAEFLSTPSARRATAAAARG